MDNRKNNGGARTGAGRKPKADEIAIIEKMDAILVPNKVWEALAGKIEEGDQNAIKLWLSYRYGQPKQYVDHTTDGDKINNMPFEVKIVEPK